MTRLAETYDLRRFAGDRLDTYVGPRSSSHIAVVYIRRGVTEVIDADIWLADLWGFTAILGLAVNFAARMEAVAAKLGLGIMNWEDFINLLETDTEFFGDFLVKGFWKPVSIYSVPAIASTAADK